MNSNLPDFLKFLTGDKPDFQLAIQVKIPWVEVGHVIAV